MMRRVLDKAKRRGFTAYD